jgi:hypothetical protein
MKKPLNDPIFKKNLTTAFHSTPPVDTPAEWHQNTLREIRRIGPLARGSAAGFVFSEMVWKAVPAFCVLLIILAAGMVSFDLSFETVINDTYLNDPVTAIYGGLFLG